MIVKVCDLVSETLQFDLVSVPVVCHLVSETLQFELLLGNTWAGFLGLSWALLGLSLGLLGLSCALLGFSWVHLGQHVCWHHSQLQVCDLVSDIIFIDFVSGERFQVKTMSLH